MRIARLDLVRYGRFTDASLPFGSAVADRPDLHVVYGDNEAGKTTVWNAILDLLFGIEGRTPYGFLHQAPAMRIAAAVECGGRVTEVVRIARARALLDPSGASAEGGPASALAGLDRDSYRTMFSLDERTLAAGGESILSSEGELGKLLFSATAGLDDLGRSLRGLRGEADRFYKPHGRKHDLAEFKRRLAELKDRIASLDVMAAPFARLVKVRDAADAAYREGVAERSKIRFDLEDVRRRLSALPRFFELRRLRSERDLLPDDGGTPPDWPEQIVELQREEVELATGRRAAGDEVRRIDGDLAALVVDDAALAAAPRARRARDLRARCTTAVKDLPDRRAGLRACEEAVSGLLCELGREGCAEPGSLLLPGDVAERLRDLIEGRSGVVSALEEARVEAADALERHGEAERALAEAGVDPDEAAALSGVAAALGAAQADGWEARQRLADRDVAVHRAVVEAHLEALAPWRGSLAALAALVLPHEAERAGWAAGLAAAEAEERTRRGEVARLEDEVHRARSAREALRGEALLVDDEAASRRRRARDLAWERHLERLDLASAEAFADALAADDAAGAVRLAQAGAIAELRGAERSLSAAGAELEIARRRFDDAEADRARWSTAVAERVRGILGHCAERPIQALEAFVQSRSDCLKARRASMASEADRRAAYEDGDRLRDCLSRSLEEAGAIVPDGADLGALASLARAALDSEERARALRLQLTERARESSERRRREQGAERRERDWTEQWRHALRSTWLGEDADVDAARLAVFRLAELGPALDRRADLADRIGKMEADRRAFAAETAAIADPLGLGSEASDPLDVFDVVERRIAAAILTDAAAAAKREEAAAARRRLSDADEALDGFERRKARMTGHYRVGTLAEVAIAIARSRRRDELNAAVASLEGELVDACAVGTIGEAEAAVASLDGAELDGRRTVLEGLRDDQDQRTLELFASLRRAEEAVEAVDADEAAARAETERRTVTLEIEERTLAHLALRAGIAAAEAAMALYRERHRSSMMADASETFRALTLDAYVGLASQGSGERETLVGLTAGGGSKLSTEMSTATRNQLYLALRIAGYREFAKTRRPPPLVLDDVLETFDDGRAEAALSLLADLSATGQVVYLTHHRHLCAIARRVCPRGSVHDLCAIAVSDNASG